MKRGTLVLNASPYPVPLFSAPQKSGAVTYIGRIEHNALAIVVRHHKSQAVNILEIITAEGIHGFIEPRYVTALTHETR